MVPLSGWSGRGMRWNSQAIPWAVSAKGSLVQSWASSQHSSIHPRYQATQGLKLAICPSTGKTRCWPYAMSCEQSRNYTWELHFPEFLHGSRSKLAIREICRFGRWDEAVAIRSWRSGVGTGAAAAHTRCHSPAGPPRCCWHQLGPQQIQVRPDLPQPPQALSQVHIQLCDNAAAAAAAAKSLQSCPTLCNPIDGSPPGSSVPGILQARTLEWVAISFSNACMHTKSLQSCPTLCDPMDSSPPGSYVHRILQSRILEWVAISFCDNGHFLWPICENVTRFSCASPVGSRPEAMRVRGTFQFVPVLSHFISNFHPKCRPCGLWKI